MPLRPSLGLKCRFCGIGTYRKIVGPDAGRLSRLGLQSASIDIRAFRCSRCGHIEWFDFQAIDDEKWWDR